MLNPGETKKIAIHIKLPANCKSGRYNAILSDSMNPSLRTVIGIKVL